MLEHHTPEGRAAPPVYDPDELPWLTEGRLDDLDGLDLRLDDIIARLIAMRDAIGALTEDMEDDDPAGGNVEDEGENDDDGEPMLGWSETASRLQECIAGEPVRYDDGEESDPAEDDDPAEQDGDDRNQADDDVGTFHRRSHGQVHPNRPQVRT